MKTDGRLRLADPAVPEVCESYRNAVSASCIGLNKRWRRVQSRHAPVTWTIFQYTGWEAPDQGWKIHIASSIRDAPRLFECVIPFLLAQKCSFKMPASIDDVVAINSGSAGRTLIGKIVTVYPRGDSEVPGLAADLDRIWQSPQAPEILTDLRIRPGSAVYIRFGAFKSGIVVEDAHGLYHGAVRRPDGALVPDERRLDGLQPPWAHSPMAGAQPVQNEAQRQLTLRGRRYFLLGALQSTPKSETFLAADEDFANTCVVKIARRGVSETATGIDGRARLKRESEFLCFLAARSFKSPRLLASADEAIVVEDIDGMPLHELPRPEIGSAFKRFAAAVAELHRLGVVHRDLKLSNAILAGKEVYLLDFELSAFAGAPNAPVGGTPGHMSPELKGAPAAFATDIFTLGASLAHAALGVDPGILAPGVGRLRALLCSIGQSRIAPIVAATMHVNPQKRRTARKLASQLEELPDDWPLSFQNCPELARAPAAQLEPPRSRRILLRKILEAATWAAGSTASRLAQSAPVAPMPGPSPHAISSGVAGHVLGLAAIDFAVKRNGFDKAILGAAGALARDIKESPALGFFTGQAGVAFVLALAGRKYARHDLFTAGRRLFIAAVENVAELDLFFGAAGIVWSACLLASICNPSGRCAPPLGPPAY